MINLNIREIMYNFKLFNPENLLIEGLNYLEGKLEPNNS